MRSGLQLVAILRIALECHTIETLPFAVGGFSVFGHVGIGARTM
jgi:hypothetical protein